MKEFLLVFHGDYNAMPQLSPEEMQANTQKWMNWVGGIAAQGNLADRGNRLHKTGKVVKGGGAVTDGPYAEIKESIMGYTMVKCESLEGAAALADGCPILAIGGCVEVREINAL